MAKRITSALIMLPLLILLVFGGIPLYVVEFLLIVVGMYEFYSVFEKNEIYPMKFWAYIFAIFILLKNIMVWDIASSSIVFLILFFMAILNLLREKNNIVDFAITILGMIYIGIFFDTIIILYDYMPDGNKLVWLIFLISFGTDIFAFLVGVNFGKHKLIPNISPKKTIEGSIGGILASVLLCILYGIIVSGIPYYLLIIVGIFGSIVSQVGDLFASSIKRYCKVKDYGNIIPGHGGILDRFDSVLMTAPVILALAYILI